jgi:hypothetical protein
MRTGDENCCWMANVPIYGCPASSSGTGDHLWPSSRLLCIHTKPPPRLMWSFVPTTRAKDSIEGFRLSIRESLTTNPAPIDTLDIRIERLQLGEQCWRQVAPAAPLPCSLAGLLPAQPVLLSSEWQLIINSTVHRINVQ